MPTPTDTDRVERIEAWTTPDVLSAVKRAAESEGRSVNDFVVAAARAAAERTIEKAQIIRLSLADQERIATVLASPPVASEALDRAFAAQKELIRDST
jgi:uncharacterized protein (DUF1778 family)